MEIKNETYVPPSILDCLSRPVTSKTAFKVRKGSTGTEHIELNFVEPLRDFARLAEPSQKTPVQLSSRHYAYGDSPVISPNKVENVFKKSLESLPKPPLNDYIFGEPFRNIFPSFFQSEERIYGKKSVLKKPFKRMSTASLSEEEQIPLPPPANVTGQTEDSDEDQKVHFSQQNLTSESEKTEGLGGLDSKEKSPEASSNFRKQGQTLLAEFKEAIQDIKEISSQKDSSIKDLVRNIEFEHSVYDSFFGEAIRQISEDDLGLYGEILGEIQMAYITLLRRAPKNLINLEVELKAQRKINAELSLKLKSSRQSINQMLTSHEKIKKHKQIMTKQLNNCDKKIFAVLNNTGKSYKNVSSFNALYNLQKNRLIRQFDTVAWETQAWKNRAVILAQKVQKMTIVTPSTHDEEMKRFSFVEHVNKKIGLWGKEKIEELKQMVNPWKDLFFSTTKTILEDDKLQLQHIMTIRNEMRVMKQYMNTNVDEEMAMLETNYPFLQPLQIFDVTSVIGYLNSWTKKAEEVQVRFDSDHEGPLANNLVKLSVEKELLTDFINKLLTSCKNWTNGPNYYAGKEKLDQLGLLFDNAIEKLKMKAVCTIGLALDLRRLEGQIEEALTTYSVKDVDKPILHSDRETLKNLLGSWLDIIDNIIGILCDNQSQVQATVENELLSLVDDLDHVLRYDYDARKTENQRIHNMIDFWFVSLSRNIGKISNYSKWEKDIVRIDKELIHFEDNLAKDTLQLKWDSPPSETFSIIRQSLIQSMKKTIHTQLHQLLKKQIVESFQRRSASNIDIEEKLKNTKSKPDVKSNEPVLNLKKGEIHNSSMGSNPFLAPIQREELHKTSNMHRGSNVSLNIKIPNTEDVAKSQQLPSKRESDSLQSGVFKKNVEKNESWMEGLGEASFSVLYKKLHPPESGHLIPKLATNGSSTSLSEKNETTLPVSSSSVGISPTSPLATKGFSLTALQGSSLPASSSKVQSTVSQDSVMPKTKKT